MEEPPSYERLRSLLEPLLCNMNVEKLIMGWSTKVELYQNVIRLAKRYGVEVYLWLPVLSETGLLKPIGRLIDDEGNEVQTFGLKNGENFEFYCPNQKRNAAGFLDIYDEIFSDIPFDGVFLDKIRYCSFSNGKSGVFSCFCPECQKAYAAAGISQEELLVHMKRVRAGDGDYQGSPLGIKSYQAGKYRFANPIWEEFFAYKQRCVYEFLKPISKTFRDKGLKIGMDTFSPFTAYFAGQDIAALSELADFIKPMMYRLTGAPAGMPWECERLLRETLTKPFPEVLSRIPGMENAGGMPFDLEFVKSEIEQLSAVGVPLYPGIEINRIEPIARTTPEYIRETVNALSQTAIQGFTLSWDLMSAPPDNLEEAARLFGRRE